MGRGAVFVRATLSWGGGVRGALAEGAVRTGVGCVVERAYRAAEVRGGDFGQAVGYVLGTYGVAHHEGVRILLLVVS